MIIYSYWARFFILFAILFSPAFINATSQDQQKGHNRKKNLPKLTITPITISFIRPKDVQLAFESNNPGDNRSAQIILAMALSNGICKAFRNNSGTYIISAADTEKAFLTLDYNIDDPAELARALCNRNIIAFAHILIKHPEAIKKYDQKTDTSLLHLASRHRFPQAISLLLAQKVDVNAEHPYTHDTALHEALRCQSNDETYQTITLLLNAGADANVENIWGKTPLDFACEHNDKSIVELLLVCESYAEERMLASTSNDIKNLLLQHLPAQRKSWWSAWCCSRNR